MRSTVCGLLFGISTLTMACNGQTLAEESASTASSDATAGASSAASDASTLQKSILEPDFPACPEVGGDESKPKSVSPGCPADGHGNLDTWIYTAWFKQLPIWIGHVDQVVESKGFWPASGDEGKTAWAEPTEFKATVHVDQTLHLIVAPSQFEIKGYKPGCYPITVTAAADEWTKKQFTQSQTKFCTNIFRGAPVLQGGSFLFIGGHPEWHWSIPLDGGVLTATASKLSQNLSIAQIKAHIDSVLKKK